MKPSTAKPFTPEKYYPFVGKIVSRYCFDGNHREDLFQSGIIGLLKAAEHYDNLYENSFMTYAFPYIKGEILSALAQIKGEKKDFYRSKAKILSSETTSDFDSQRKLSENDDITLTILSEQFDFADEQAEDMFQKAELRLMVNEIFRTLSQTERRLLYYRYFLNLNQTETGKCFGISQSEISRREKSILKKIRNEF